MRITSHEGQSFTFSSSYGWIFWESDLIKYNVSDSTSWRKEKERRAEAETPNPVAATVYIMQPIPSSLTVSLSDSFVIGALLLVKSSSCMRILISVLLIGIMLFLVGSVGKISGGNRESEVSFDDFTPPPSIALPLTDKEQKGHRDCKIRIHMPSFHVEPKW